jgi:F-type H+-transporting ATPase subunit gamma
MSAMDAATDSAKTMMESLRLSYNHLRQDMITRELVEIISGSEAMK